MPDSIREPLPKVAKGLDLGELVLAIAKNKLVFAPKGTPEHYTLHGGPHSKVIDFHKTTLRADGTIERQTLFSIKHELLVAMMEELAPSFLQLLMRLARPLSPAWMKKRRVGVVVGLLPTGPNITAVGQLRHRKFGIDPRRLAARAWAPDSVDDLYDLDGEIFTLFLNQRHRRPRKLGHGFSITDSRGKPKLMWIPDRNMAEAMQRGIVLLKAAATKYGSAKGAADAWA